MAEGYKGQPEGCEGQPGVVEVLPGKLAWAPGCTRCYGGRDGPVVLATALCAPKSQEGESAGSYLPRHYPKKLAGRASRPLGLDSVIRFCRGLSAKLSAADGLVVLGSPASDENMRMNTAMLLGAYLVLHLSWTVPQAADAIGSADAGRRYVCSWPPTDKKEPGRVLTVADCWSGLALAQRLGWAPALWLESDVDVDKACAEYVSQVVTYDCTWIVDGQLMVGADPTTVVCDPNPSTCGSLLPPDDVAAGPGKVGAKDGTVSDVADDSFVSFFLRWRIGLVVRANFHKENGMPMKSYPDDVMESFGIQQANIRFPDENGGLPRPRDVQRMLEVADSFMRPGAAVMVHCKVGFGRSVVLACCLVIDRFDVPGAPLLGWVHIARPGFVITRAQELFLAGLRGRDDVRRFAGQVASLHSASCTGACAVQ